MKSSVRLVIFKPTIIPIWGRGDRLMSSKGCLWPRQEERYKEGAMIGLLRRESVRSLSFRLRAQDIGKVPQLAG